ncbi:MAG: ABC transporter permease [Spirochaetaceae bacterium]|jgi:lipooligosaccharide transport system permease protein|nr:ABC transporter permease [Spirochaetaceae bacterium]
MTNQGLLLRVAPPGVGRRLLGTGGARYLVERNIKVYRNGWLVLVSGIFEPIFYLLSVGVGVAQLVGDVQLPGGKLVSYTVFVAPAMLAASAMNGAIYDATFNLFFKLKYNKLYDAVLATPVTPVDVAVGEIGWALMRGSFYSTAFLVVMLVMGLVASWWAVLALPAVVLVGFAFAAMGTAATTYMKSWQDFEYVTLVTLPMFLFSATFYPLSTYPEALQWVIRLSPLYHAAALLRELTTGAVTAASLVHVLVLAVLGLVGVLVTGRRLEKLLLT